MFINAWIELHLINWNYQETAMYIDIAHIAKMILDFDQWNGTGLNKEPVTKPLKTGMPRTVTWRTLTPYASLEVNF